MGPNRAIPAADWLRLAGRDSDKFGRILSYFFLIYDPTMSFYDVLEEGLESTLRGFQIYWAECRSRFTYGLCSCQLNLRRKFLIISQTLTDRKEERPRFPWAGMSRGMHAR